MCGTPVWCTGELAREGPPIDRSMAALQAAFASEATECAVLAVVRLKPTWQQRMQLRCNIYIYNIYKGW